MNNIEFFGLPQVIVIYATAVIGSTAVELGALVKDLVNNNGRAPQHYTTLFIIVRVLFALLGAGSAGVVLTDPNAKLALVTAFYVGISAPLLFDRVASGTFMRMAEHDQ